MQTHARANDYARMPNQIASAAIAITTTAQTAGVTFPVLPLRGESLAAWLNSVFTRHRPSRHLNTATTLSHSDSL